jgi:patatin-like phospholipase/acyl hydrolase
LCQKLMVCTFHLNPPPHRGNYNFRPIIYHSSFIKHKKEKLVDIALRTSAGPTYFPIYQNHIDGGVAMNNPAMAAVMFAINKHDGGNGEYIYPDGEFKGLNKKIEDVKILSIGCGTSNKEFVDKTRTEIGTDWGNIQWAKFLPSLLTTSNMQITEYYMEQLLHEKQYKRISFLFDSEDAPEVIRGTKKVLKLDVKDPKLLAGMKKFALDYYDKNRDKLLKFLND